MSLLIGLDVGTTNTKAVAFEAETGRVAAVAARPTPYVSISPRASGGGDREIDPDQLWDTVVGCLREVSRERPETVRAVGIASMAEAGVPLDAAGRPLYRIIPWYDSRTEPQLQWVMAHADPRRVFEITGQAPRHVYALYKLLWLRAHRPDVFARLDRWLSVSDFVGWRLTGVAATDFSLASRTMFLDQRSGQWSPEMLNLVGLCPEQLPRLAPSGASIGGITPDAARETGLPVGAPVGISGHDHLCGALAAGAVQPGQVVDSIGTAEGLVIPVARYRDDDVFRQRRICCYRHVLPGQFVIQAGMALSGGSLAWIGQQLFGAEPDPVAAALAASAGVPPGAGGLIFFPHLGGNGSPIGDENVSAAFVGLRSSQDRANLARAVLEGIAFGVRHSLEFVEQIIGAIDEPIRVVGGGGRSSLWLQIRADVLGRPLISVEVPEAVALGAALLAGVGAGVYPDAASAAARVRRATRAYRPDPPRAASYDRLFKAAYLLLYPALAPIFAALAEEDPNEPPPS